MSLKKRFLRTTFGILLVLAALAIYSGMQVRAITAERATTLPGDDLIPQPIGVLNHAITIHRSPHDVRPWLVQMGSGRAGWYAYDFIDNCGHRSAERILPEYQRISVGSVFPAVPEPRTCSLSRNVSRSAASSLSWRLPNGRYQTTWAFVLEQPQPDQTRLIVRGPGVPPASFGVVGSQGPPFLRPNLLQPSTTSNPRTRGSVRRASGFVQIAMSLITRS